MALKYLQVDDTTGKRKRLNALFVDTHFTVASGAGTNFTVTGLTASNLVDVFVNGVLLLEGASASYQRNVGANQIQFLTNQPDNAQVRVRIWS